MGHTFSKTLLCWTSSSTFRPPEEVAWHLRGNTGNMTSNSYMTEVYTDVFQKSCDTSRGPHALWHITWDSCNTRFFCLLKLEEIWVIRWTQLVETVQVVNYLNLHWSHPKARPQPGMEWDKRQAHQPTNLRQIGCHSLCFRLSHSKWPQVLKK